MSLGTHQRVTQCHATRPDCHKIEYMPSIYFLNIVAAVTKYEGRKGIGFISEQKWHGEDADRRGRQTS